MRTRTATLLRTALLSFALATGAASALAQAPAEDPKRTEEARAHFQRGVELYKDADYRTAIIEFRRAYGLIPNWRIQYNLAQACSEVQDYPCAMRALEAYLAQGAAEIPADRRASVEEELRRVRGRIARVRIQTNRAEAEIFIDETSQGKGAPPAPVLVGAGRRRVSATLPSGQTVSKVIEVAGGDEPTVALEFPDSPPPAATPKPIATQSEPPSKVPLYVGVTVTGLLAAGTVATGILSLGAQHDLDNEVAKFPGSSSAIDSARTRGRTLAIVTDVLGGAAVVAAGITVYIALTTPSAKSSTTVGLAVAPGSLGLAGKF
jgi:hypothetical protein